MADRSGSDHLEVGGLAPGGGRGGVDRSLVALVGQRIERIDRAGVDHDRATDAAAGERAVVEALLDGGRSLGIVGEHHVLPGVVPAPAAELALQLGEQVGVGCLAAAPRAEDRPDECRRRDHVVHRERLGGAALGGVVGIGTGDVGLGVGQDRAALGAELAHDHLALLGHERLGLRARGEALRAGDEPEGVDPRHVGHGYAGRPARQPDQQATVAGGHPAGAEGDVVSRGAVDVRHAVGVVDQPQPGASRPLLGDRADRVEVLG